MIQGGKIVWIDMGMMGRLNERDRELIGQAIEGVALNDIGKIQDAVLALGEFKGKPDHSRLYQDIQEIHLRCGMTIVFVTHNMREAVCLGDRVVLLTPHPGRVCEEYFVDFPHPRDINSSDLAALSSRITRDLKGATA